MADIFDQLDTDIFDQAEAVKLSAGETAMETIKSVGRGFSQFTKTPGILAVALGEQIQQSTAAPPAPGRNQPEWVTKIGDAINTVASKVGDTLKVAGDNIVAYYNKGIEGNVLAPSAELQQARQEPFSAHPISRTLTATGESAPVYAASVAATLLTANPTVGLTMLSTVSGTQTYETLRNEGLDPDLALLGGALAGSIEAVTEKIPMELLLKGRGKPFLKRFLIQGTAESFQEFMAQLGQNYVTEAAKNRGIKGQTGLDALRVEWNGITDGWQDAMAAGFVMGGGAAIVSGKTGPSVEPQVAEGVQAQIEPQAGQGVTQPSEPSLINARIYDKDVDITVNPTLDDMKNLSDEFNKEFPNAPKGTPYVRTLYDTNGNKYIWPANKATHIEMMNALSEKYGVPVEEFTQQYTEKPPTPQAQAQIEPQGAEVDLTPGPEVQQDVPQQVQQKAIETELQQRYDDLLTRVQEGDEEAVDALNKLNYEATHPEVVLPTYEDLLLQATEGDAAAMNKIQRGAYQGGTAEAEALAEQQGTEHEYISRKLKAIPGYLTEAQRNNWIATFRQEYKQNLSFAKIKAHSIAKAINITKAERMALSEELTGKASMKDMTLDEAHAVVDILTQMAKELNVVTSTPKELAEYIGLPKEHILSWQEKTGLSKILEDIKQGFSKYMYGHKRVERMLEALDNYTKGVLYKTIWTPVKIQFENSQDMAHARTNKLLKFVTDLTGDKNSLTNLVTSRRRLIIPKTGAAPELRLSSTELIEFYLQAHQQNGLEHLVEGNLKDFNNPEAVLGDILNAMTEQERAIAEWMVSEIGENFERANQAAILAFNRPLQQNTNYFHITVQGTELDAQQDPLNTFLEFQRTGAIPQIGEIQERKPGARQALELDAFTHYIQHVQRIEQFIHMAPTARSISNIFNDKQFRQAVNAKTNNAGMPILDKWLRDATRGYSTESQSTIGRMMLYLRTRGVQYALTGNIPSVLRQFNSIPHAVAVDPVIAGYAALEMLESADPRHFNRTQAGVMQKSIMMRTRNFDRIQAYIRQQNPAKQLLLNKKPWSSKALSWQRWADRRTTVMMWKAAYNAAQTEAMQQRLNIPATEEGAIEFADNVIERTQPMGDVIHLPDFFRGGPIEKLLTTFQNQVNNNWQFWSHDIYQMHKHGKINNTQVAYRILMGYTIPAFIFGVIGRGGLPKSWEGALFDQAIYFLSWPVLFGRIFVNALRGFVGGETGVEMTGAVEAGKTVEELKDLNYSKAAKHGVKAVGATTGVIPAQAIRTAEGAYDLATGETKDLRRLVWSKWTLEQNKAETNKVERKR